MNDLLVQRHSRERGSALVTSLWVIIALTAVVLVLARSMSVENLVSAQHVAQAKADVAEIGVEQLVQAAITSELLTPGYIDTNMVFEQRQLGECYFWIMKLNPSDEQLPAYGLSKEAGKLDINTATYDQLLLLPNMTDEIASCIIDWRDTDDDQTGMDGAEDAYYMNLPTPYHVKSAPFESLEEIKLVKGVTPDILYGADTNHNDVIDLAELNNANEGMSFETSMRGIMSFLTVYGLKATTPAPATNTTGGITGGVTTGTTTTTTPLADVNSTNTANLQTVLNQYLAGRAQQILQLTQQGRPFANIWDWAVRVQLTADDFAQVYMSVQAVPGRGGGRGGFTSTTPTAAKVDITEASMATMVAIGMDESEAQAVVTYRETTNIDPSEKANIAWLLSIVAPNKFRTLGSLITGTSTVYSADIVTVTHDGRAFKRVRIVVDASTGTPQTIYRRDMTSEGWPLDPEIRQSLRLGHGPDGAGDTVMTGGNNGPSLGFQ